MEDILEEIQIAADLTASTDATIRRQQYSETRQIVRDMLASDIGLEELFTTLLDELREKGIILPTFHKYKK